MLDSTDRQQYRNFLFANEDVKRDGLLLRYCSNIQDELSPEKAEKLCLTAVSQDGMALEYVKVKSPDICLKAVTRTGRAIKFCEEQTDELIEAALKKDGMALRYINIRTEESCIQALANTPFAIQFVPDKYQTLSMCRDLLIDHPELIADMHNQSEDLCQFVLRVDPRSIQYIRDQTEERCLFALRGTGLALRGIRDPSPEMIAMALKQVPDLVGLLDQPCPGWALFAAAYKIQGDFTEMLADRDAWLVRDTLLSKAELYLPGISKL